MANDVSEGGEIMSIETLTNKNDKLLQILKERSPSEFEFYENRYKNEMAGNAVRTRIIVEHLLSPYYAVDSNRKVVDEYLDGLESIYEEGIGMFSFPGVYNEKMNELENLLGKLVKYKM